MKYSILPIIVIAVLFINGCSQRVAPTLAPITSAPASTQILVPTLRVATETAAIETPFISPTTTPEQNFNFTVQCLDIQPAIPNDFEFSGNIVLKDYYDNRTLSAMHPSSGSSSTTIFGEEVLYPFISPNGKMLAYLDIF